MRFHTTLILLLSTSLLGTALSQHDHAGHSHHAHHHDTPATQPASQPASQPAITERVGDPWPLDTCIVSGGTLGSMGEPLIKLHEGREVRFCCEGCIANFDADPVSYLREADKKIKEQQKSLYPLNYCIIDTHESLDATDESKNAYAVTGNRLFIYCCPPCDDKVRMDPEKYIGILNEAAIEKQKPEYPLDTCVISGNTLDSSGTPTDRVVAGRLVRLCSPACEEKLMANPVESLAKITAAETKTTDATPQ